MKYLKMLLYENDELSLTRVIAVIGWLAFLAVSAYLVYTHQNGITMIHSPALPVVAVRLRRL